jgi:hypothetical protein
LANRRSLFDEEEARLNHRRRMLAQWRAARALDAEGFTRICGRSKQFSREQYVEFKQTLDIAPNERTIHAFLKRHLEYFPCAQRNCYWIKSEPSLGGALRPDFMTCHMDSSGMSWTLVELEGLYDQVFTRAGRPAARLREAFEQVDDWRQWLQGQDGFAANRTIYRGLAGLPYNTSNVDGSSSLEGPRNDLRETIGGSATRSNGAETPTFIHTTGCLSGWSSTW